MSQILYTEYKCSCNVLQNSVVVICYKNCGCNVLQNSVVVMFYKNCGCNVLQKMWL